MEIAELLMKVGGPKAKASIVNPVAAEWSSVLPVYGISRPVREAHFIPQIAHESAGFSTLVELGPDSYFKKYDGRTDLGNTQPGDGLRFKGRGLIQLTGRYNYGYFGDKVAKKFGLPAGYFVSNPEEAANPKYSLALACEYWADRKLNDVADWSDQEAGISQITKKINGGLNGFEDRVRRFGNTLLYMNGYGATQAEVRRFQTDSAIDVDGKIGPQTRGAAFKKLLGANGTPQIPEPAARPVDPKPVDRPPDPPRNAEPKQPGIGGIIGFIVRIFKWFLGRRTG